MGLYRTKPEEVEAIQYSGGMSQPFDEQVPEWVWRALSVGALSFKGHGLEINYNGLTEQVVPNDWLVLHNDGIIRCCGDAVFKTYYTPARKRRYDDVTLGQEVPTAAADAQTQNVGAAA